MRFVAAVFLIVAWCCYCILHADVERYCIRESQKPSFPGDGESIKDPSEEKPESEAAGVEEPVVGEEEGESVEKDAGEHVELW